MKIALAQINPTVGAFRANIKTILAYSIQAQAQGASVIVFSEMVLCGYPPLDLVFFDSFVQDNKMALADLACRLPQDLLVFVGYVKKRTQASEKNLENTMVGLWNGQVVFEQSKSLLPTYDVFDERRYFCSADSCDPFFWQGLHLGIAICEDFWADVAQRQGAPYGTDPVAELVKKGANLIICPSASPFYPGKKALRLSILQEISQRYAVPVLFVNQVGGNDSLIFDGSSMATDSKGRLVLQGPSFVEGISVFDTEHLGPPLTLVEETLPDLNNALVLGLRDYVRKSGFSDVHLGLSGGIDSAIVAALATQALGAEHVYGFALPSRYSSDHSLSDARALATNLGIRYDVLSIEHPLEAFFNTLRPTYLNDTPEQISLTEENLQARIRGTLLMAISNKTGSMLLATGNKSELATGYCTLYGDMAGALAVIGDVFKTEIYQLAAWINCHKQTIPSSILTKSPSAELRPNQIDQDSLPPYDVLDRILKKHVLDRQTATQIIASGEPKPIVEHVLRLVATSEYKRWQAPMVLKVSEIAFGLGRRHPLTRHQFEIDPYNKKPPLL